VFGAPVGRSARTIQSGRTMEIASGSVTPTCAAPRTTLVTSRAPTTGSALVMSAPGTIPRTKTTVGEITAANELRMREVEIPPMTTSHSDAWSDVSPLLNRRSSSCV